jgi:hypothetical protein
MWAGDRDNENSLHRRTGEMIGQWRQRPGKGGHTAPSDVPGMGSYDRIE